MKNSTHEDYCAGCTGGREIGEQLRRCDCCYEGLLNTDSQKCRENNDYEIYEEQLIFINFCKDSYTVTFETKGGEDFTLIVILVVDEYRELLETARIGEMFYVEYHITGHLVSMI